MKKGFFLLLSGIVSIGILFHFTSCQKANNTGPKIALYSSSLYLAKDTTLEAGTIFSVYVTASKAGVDQLLKSATISLSVNGGPDSVIQQMNLSSQYLSQFYSYTTADSGNVERYTFSVTQSNDMSADTSITITAK